MEIRNTNNLFMFETSPSYFKDKNCFTAKERGSNISITPYQRGEFSYTPDSKSHSWYGGGGLVLKAGHTSLDCYIAGKTTSANQDGYFAEAILNQTWPEMLQPIDDLKLSSNVRSRYINCGGSNIQYRFAPVKAVYKINNNVLPFEDIYLYPGYVTYIKDTKTGEDNVKFGGIFGITKKINNKSYYVEAQADTNNKKNSDVTFCINAGFKF